MQTAGKGRWSEEAESQIKTPGHGRPSSLSPLSFVDPIDRSRGHFGAISGHHKNDSFCYDSTPLSSLTESTASFSP
jgi:hypothetical protein